MTDSDYIQKLIDETARIVFIPGGTYVIDKPKWNLSTPLAFRPTAE
jgi:hypothetical protein